jgi:hypothetical protein
MSGGLAVPGRFAKIEVSQDGINFLNLGGIIDVTLNINVDELECTTHDSNGVREYIPNHSDFSLDVSSRWVDGDPGQRLVMIATQTKQRFTFRFFMDIDPGSGKFFWEGLAFATTASPSGPLDDTGSLDLTLRASGVQQLTQ